MILLNKKKKLLENCSNLEELHLIGECLPNIECSFLKLNTFKLKQYKSTLNYNTFRKFLKLNPDLKHLNLNIFPYDEIISAIVKYTPNVEALELNGFFGIGSLHSTKKGFQNIIKLKKLRQLSLLGYSNDYLAMELMAALSNANIRIENVSLVILDIGPVKSISNLKTIRTLSIHNFKRYNENELISLLSELPLLNKLKLQFEKD